MQALYHHGDRMPSISLIAYSGRNNKVRGKSIDLSEQANAYMYMYLFFLLIYVTIRFEDFLPCIGLG